MTAAELAALHGRCFTVPRPFNVSEFEDFLSNELCFLIEIPHGFALGRAVADEAELLTLAVDPDHRRLGGGTMLVQGFEDEARRRQTRRAFLEVAADNQAARALYRNAGYRDCGCRKAYYRAAGCRTADAIVMEKALSPT